MNQAVFEQQIRAEFRVVHRNGIDERSVPADLLKAPDVVKQAQE